MPNYKRLLLMSNSTNPGQRPLEHAAEAITDFLGNQIKTVLFVPFASVTSSFDDFASSIRQSFRNMNYGLHSLHSTVHAVQAVERAEAIVVGGGNTFVLIDTLYRMGLLKTIRARVRKGVPYIGWSAGANIACPTIKTTNDMPIVDPRTLNALNLVPFQINPHFMDTDSADCPGETRTERIAEFIAVNPEVYVVGLRDGTMLRIEGPSLKVIGLSGVRVFRKGKTAGNYGPQDSLQFLLANIKKDK